MAENRQRCGGGKTLSSRILHIRTKMFHLKAIKEEQGTMIKITESFLSQYSQIDLSLSASKELRDRLNDLEKFYASLLSVSRIPASTNTILKTVRIKGEEDRKRYILNFIENSKGRFVKICQTSSISGDIG